MKLSAGKTVNTANRYRPRQLGLQRVNPKPQTRNQDVPGLEETYLLGFLNMISLYKSSKGRLFGVKAGLDPPEAPTGAPTLTLGLETLAGRPYLDDPRRGGRICGGTSTNVVMVVHRSRRNPYCSPKCVVFLGMFCTDIQSLFQGLSENMLDI